MILLHLSQVIIQEMGHAVVVAPSHVLDLNKTLNMYMY